MPRTSLAILALLAFAPFAAAQPASLPRPADPALAAVPTDSLLFVSVKASKLWDNPAAKPLRDWLATQKERPFDAVVGLEPADVDRLTLFAPAASRDAEPMLLVTTRKPYNEAKVLKALGVGQPDGRRGRTAGRVTEIGGTFRWVSLVDDQTLLFLPRRMDEEAGLNLVAQLIARKADGPLAPALLAAQTHDVTVGLDVRGLERMIGDDGGARELAPYLVLLKAKTATLTADFDNTARGQLVLAFPDAATAKRAAPVLEEGIKTIADKISEESNRPRAESVEKHMFGWAISVLKAAKVTAAGNDVVAAADVPYADELAKFVTALPKSFALARNSAAAQNNLKQLALGMHNMHDVYGQIPGDVSPAGGGVNAPAMSWRVNILPFIEQDNLYKRLDTTKPWDDPANLKVLEAAEMPKVFEVPGRPAPKGHTYFRVFSFPKNAKGNDRPFFVEGQRGPRFADVTDGLSNTFMIVEAREAVPWYKPDVLAYDGKLPLPALGDKETDTFLVAFGDGSVRVLKAGKLGEQTLRALITRAGGEVTGDLDR